MDIRSVAGFWLSVKGAAHRLGHGVSGCSGLSEGETRESKENRLHLRLSGVEEMAGGPNWSLFLTQSPRGVFQKLSELVPADGNPRLLPGVRSEPWAAMIGGEPQPYDGSMAVLEPEVRQGSTAGLREIDASGTDTSN